MKPNGEPHEAAVAAQVQANEALWAGSDMVRYYTGRVLRPPEVMLLALYNDALHGRVLELGCGAGRISSYLVELASEFRGLDISAQMVAQCRSTYRGEFEVGDLRDLSAYAEGSYDVVVASYNVLDVLDEPERSRVLSDIHRVLADDGLLMFSSHNLAHAPAIPKPTSVRTSDPLRGAADLLRMPRRVRNHRRLRALQQVASDHAILIDEAHDFSILHYYVGRDVQATKLAALGFELLRCLDLGGFTVAPGEHAAHSAELHYVAGRTLQPKRSRG